MFGKYLTQNLDTWRKN